jgi:hypothetical protein
MSELRVLYLAPVLAARGTGMKIGQDLQRRTDGPLPDPVPQTSGGSRYRGRSYASPRARRYRMACGAVWFGSGVGE